MEECEECGSEDLSIEVDDDGDDILVCNECGNEIPL
jgi:hypothetical protein